VLEFSKVAKPLRKAYDWYSFNVLPRVGSSSRATPTATLPRRVDPHASDQETLKAMMKAAGFGTWTCTT